MLTKTGKGFKSKTLQIRLIIDIILQIIQSICAEK